MRLLSVAMLVTIVSSPWLLLQIAAMSSAKRRLFSLYPPITTPISRFRNALASTTSRMRIKEKH